MVSLDRLFQEDFEDGHLDQLMLAPLPLNLVVPGQIGGHYLAMSSPHCCWPCRWPDYLLNIAPQDLPGLMAAMALGTPALVLLGGIGASLAVSVRRGGLLTVLLTLAVLCAGADFRHRRPAGGFGGGDGYDAPCGLWRLSLSAALCFAPLAIAAH